MNSIAGLLAPAMRTSYVGSKHALRGFFDSLRSEVIFKFKEWWFYRQITNNIVMLYFFLGSWVQHQGDIDLSRLCRYWRILECNDWQQGWNFWQSRWKYLSWRECGCVQQASYQRNLQRNEGWSYHEESETWTRSWIEKHIVWFSALSDIKESKIAEGSYEESYLNPKEYNKSLHVCKCISTAFIHWFWDI